MRALAGRLLVAAAVAGAAALVGSTGPAPAAGACRPTVSQGGGPFSTSGGAPPRRSRIGKGHVLIGQVLRYPDCAPVRGAVVELWQESPNGSYDRRGRASVVTSRLGGFRFEGPIPPSDFGRPHIHVHVSAAGYEDLVTTYVIPGRSRQGRITVVLVSLL